MQKSLEEMRAVVAANLSAALYDQHLTQKDLSEKFQISRATASNWCKGVKKPRTENIIALASWLQVPVDYLLGTGVFVDWTHINANRKAFMDAVRELFGSEMTWDLAYVVYGFDPETPNKAPLNDFAYFIYDCFTKVDYKDGNWVLETANTKPASTTGDGSSEIQLIFDQLTPANQSKLIELSRLYLAAQSNNGETK